MSNSVFSLYETITSHLKGFEKDLSTGTIGVVESYDPTKGTIDVFPAIHKRDGSDGVLIKYQMLYQVPYIFPATQDFGITYPLKKGDTVWLMFGHSNIEEWLLTDKEYAQPKTNRSHDINDAVAIGGIFKQSKSPIPEGSEDNLSIRYGDTNVQITPEGEVIVNSANTITINAPDKDVNIDAANLKVTGNIKAEGDVSDGLGALSRLRTNYNEATYIGYAGVTTSTTMKPDV